MWNRIRDHLPQAGLVVLEALLGIAGTAIAFYTEIREDLAKYDAKDRARREYDLEDPGRPQVTYVQPEGWRVNP